MILGVTQILDTNKLLKSKIILSIECNRQLQLILTTLKLPSNYKVPDNNILSGVIEHIILNFQCSSF